MPDYSIAVEIAIEEAELGTSPYGWDDCPFADVRYGVTSEEGTHQDCLFAQEDTVPFSPEDTVPFSPEDEKESASLFGDSESSDPEEWMVGLSDRDLYTMMRAIDDIREISSRAGKPLPMPVLAKWINP